MRRLLVAFLAVIALVAIMPEPAPHAQQGVMMIQPIRCILTNRSFNATTSASNLMAANGSRNYLLIQNPSTAALQGIAVAESAFIDLSGAASVGGNSIEIQPGGSFTMEGTAVSTQAVSVISATTNHRVIAKEC